MMSWRLWAAFVDLLNGLGAELAELSHANEGQISAEQARDWAMRLRPVVGRSVRYVQGGLSWFEISSTDGEVEVAEPVLGPYSAVRNSLLARVMPSLSDDELQMEDTEETAEWLGFVADYLEHSGGCLER